MADSFPVGPAYTSPGFAVSSTVDEILDKQKFERRQALLDALNTQKIQSEIASQNENTAGLAQQRKARGDDYEAQAFQRNIAMLPKGADLSHVDSGLLNEMIKRGVATPGVDPENGAMGTSGISVDQGWGQPAQTASGSIDPELAASGVSSLGTTAPKTNPTFNGSPTEQQGQEQFDNLQKLSRMDLSKYTPVQQWAIMRAYDPKGVMPADLFKQQASDEVPMMSFDQATQTLKPLMINGKPFMGKKGERPLIVPRPAQGPAPKEAQFYSWDEPGVNGAAPTHVGGFMMPPTLKPGESQAVDLANFRKGSAQNPPAPHGNGLYDAGAYSKLQSTVTNQNAQPTDIQRAQTNVINSVGGAHPTTDDLAMRHWLAGVIWDPSHWDMPLANIKKQLIDSGADDASAQKAVDIFSALMIPDIAGPAGSAPPKQGLLGSLLGRGK